MVAPVVAASLISGGASILGGLMGSSSAKKANKAAAAEAEANRAFQREMAQNAHQYEVADLRAAGLNPILSAGGSGASASGGAGQPQVFIESDSASKGISSALEAAAQSASLENVKADTALKKTSAIAQTASAEQSLAGAQSARAQARVLGVDADNKGRLAPLNKLGGDLAQWVSDKVRGSLKQMNEPASSAKGKAIFDSPLLKIRKTN